MTDTFITTPPIVTGTPGAVEIELPALEDRPWGLFTQVVESTPVRDTQGVDRTGGGAKWMVRGPYVYELTDVDCETIPDPDDDEIPIDVRGTKPFSLSNYLECSTIGGLEMPEINAMLLSDSEAVRSAALTKAITTQISADHINLLTNSTLLAPASTNVGTAISAVEGALADRIANKRGHIFVPIEHLATAFEMSAVSLEGDRLVSAAGHWVISDAGHGLNDHVFGTGAVTYALLPARPLLGQEGYLDRARNRMIGITTRYGLVAFNPLHSVRASF